jgi:hypothetical protein
VHYDYLKFWALHLTCQSALVADAKAHEKRRTADGYWCLAHTLACSLVLSSVHFVRKLKKSRPADVSKAVKVMAIPDTLNMNFSFI